MSVPIIAPADAPTPETLPPVSVPIIAPADAPTPDTLPPFSSPPVGPPVDLLAPVVAPTLDTLVPVTVAPISQTTLAPVSLAAMGGMMGMGAKSPSSAPIIGTAPSGASIGMMSNGGMMGMGTKAPSSGAMGPSAKTISVNVMKDEKTGTLKKGARGRTLL